MVFPVAALTSVGSTLPSVAGRPTARVARVRPPAATGVRRQGYRMTQDSVFLETLFVNLPTLLVLVFAWVYLKGGGRPSLFLVGLSLVLVSGLVAVPLSAWLWSKFPEYMSQSTTGTVLSVAAIGLIHSAGLVCCVIAYGRRVRAA